MRSAVLTWAQIAHFLHQHPEHQLVTLTKSQVEHPVAAGLEKSLGLPLGQLSDWRLPAGSCHGLHVREYVDRYTAHIDEANPNCDLPAHIIKDAPAIGGGAALGALVGLIVGESAGAMLLGALVGGALGTSAATAREQALETGGKSYLGGFVTTGGGPRRR